MKFSILVFCVFFVILHFANAYTTRFNHVDIDAILKNERLINVYLRCVMEGKGCTAEGTELKRLLPDAIKTGCSKCTEQQKKGAAKVFRFLRQEKPAVYQKIMEKFDPKKIYKDQWNAILNA